MMDRHYRHAKELGVSDQAVRKHCLKLGLNPPERGYWQKKRAGAQIRSTSSSFETTIVFSLLLFQVFFLSEIKRS